MKRLAVPARVAAGLLLGAAIIAGLALARLGWSDAAGIVDRMTRAAAEAGPLGWIAFAIGQALVAMIGIVPASLLGIAAGAVYGIGLGFGLAAAGTLVGGWLAFRLARSLLRPWVERLIKARAGSRLAGLDAAVGRDGWRFVCLMRISPIMPFALTSYALGLTEISGRDYILGTLAALPALAGYVAIGALARQGVLSATGATTPGPLNWVLLGVGGVATAALILRSGTLLARSGLLPRPAGRPPA